MNLCALTRPGLVGCVVVNLGLTVWRFVLPVLQATVLRQIGLLPELPCVSGPEQAAKAANHNAAPSNKLIQAAAAAGAVNGSAAAHN